MNPHSPRVSPVGPPVLVASLALALLGSSACSTIPGLPQSGGGSRFNLATVDYVNQSDARVEDRVGDAVEERVPAEVEAALVEDRRRISKLQEAALQQSVELERLTDQMAALTLGVDQALAELRASSEEFQAGAQEVEATRVRLDAAIAALPVDVLRLLGEAVEQRLAAEPARAEPEAPPSEFTEPEEAAAVEESEPVPSDQARARPAVGAGRGAGS